MAEGVTTLEVKSGYGLDLATERRMLEVARALARDLPLSIATTFLGLHALPAEYRERRGEYVAAVCGPVARVARRGAAWWMRSMRFARTSRSPSRRPTRFSGRRGGSDCAPTCTPAS